MASLHAMSVYNGRHGEMEARLRTQNCELELGSELVAKCQVADAAKNERTTGVVGNVAVTREKNGCHCNSFLSQLQAAFSCRVAPRRQCDSHRAGILTHESSTAVCSAHAVDDADCN